MASKTDPLVMLADDIASLTHDPLGHAMYAYPWGQGVLADSAGPREWACEVMEDIREHLENPETRYQPLRIAVASGHGIAKGHRLDDMVETPTGFRIWGDLGIGDQVFDAEGSPTLIIGTNRYRRAHYLVKFDDGSSISVSGQHLWNVRGRQERRTKRDGWRTLETAEIINLGVKRSNGVAQARQWEIPIQGPAEFPSAELPVHPYFMGLWLGDGTRGTAKYSKPYLELVERLTSLGVPVKLANDGFTVALQSAGNVLEIDPVFGCYSHQRYIPERFKYASVDQRIELFRGLCDSDGETHSSGSIGYSTTSKPLADDVAWLARSLGCKAIVSGPQRASYRNGDGEIVECRDYYRLTINSPFNPFTIKHRRINYKPSEPRYLTRWIDSIEPEGLADGMCITVANPDGLYQARDFIVTHNSATIGMIVKWGLDTCDDCRIVITANTENQLLTKTGPEITKWHRLAITEDWFNPTATKFASTTTGHADSWRADLVTWSENNTEAFAGLHNQGKRIIIIYDEASKIAQKVWEVTMGALTDEKTEIIWLAFGNPTQNTGAFRECFAKHRNLWKTYQIDSRAVEGTNKTYLNELVQTYGEDSDIVKVRVRGMFPSTSSMQFISVSAVEGAQSRDIQVEPHDPLVIGVDVARFGDDSSVICFRRGRDARSIPSIKLHGVDTMQLAAKVAEQQRLYGADMVCVDEGGVGGGVVDRLRQMGLPVVGVQFGARPLNAVRLGNGEKVANRRAEMWAIMREWLQGGMIPVDQELYDDLIGVEYSFNVRDEIQLEKKEHMKARGLSSPDIGDALCFEGSTLIATAKGEVRIDEIQCGDEVLTPFGSSRVAKVWLSRAHDVTTTKFSNGAALAGKGQHKVFTFTRGPVRLDALQLTDVLDINSRWRRFLWRVVKLSFIAGRSLGFKAAIDIIRATRGATGRRDFFIVGCGLTTMALFQRATTFITRMKTGATTNWTTWSASRPEPIDETTCSPVMRERMDTRPLSKASLAGGTLPSNGTLLQRGWLGTPLMAAPFGTGVSQPMSVSARGADRNLWRSLKGPVFAPSNAKPQLAIHGISRTLAHAGTAIKSLWRTVIGIRDVAPVSVQTAFVQEGVPTYNLTLYRDNAYYANGILVFNCLTFAVPVLPSYYEDEADSFAGDDGRDPHGGY